MPTNTKKLMRELVKLSSGATTKYNKTLLKSYKTALAQVRDEILQLYLKLGKSKEFAIAANKLANLEKNIAGLIIDLNADAVNTIRSGTTNIYKINFNGTNKALAEFGIVNKKAVEASVSNPMRWENALGKYSASLLGGVKQIITNGILTGEGYEALARKVTERFNISANNAMRILRTEVHRNENAAKLDSINENLFEMRAQGLNVAKFWISVVDGRTRDSHIEMNDTQANANGIFTFPAGGETEAPGLSGIPQEDINCRCTIILDFIPDIQN